MSARIDALRKLLLNHVDHFARRVSVSSRTYVPTGFELGSREYLAFAEEELERDAPQSRINCVTHLKRAVENRVDTFLHYYNLHAVARKKNLFLAAKLELIEKIGLVSARSLRRFNTIRNRIEHEYAAPDIPDLEVYFDLVQAVVLILEITTLVVSADGAKNYAIMKGPFPETEEIGRFSLQYFKDNPRFAVEWEVNGEKESLQATVRETEEFAYFFRVYILLHRRAVDMPDRVVKSML